MSERNAFLEAVKAGDAARVTQLLDAEPALVNARTDSGQSAVLLALYYGKKAVRDLLLRRGAELNFHEAAAAGKADTVAGLLAADPGLANSHAPDGFTALGLAAYFGHREIVELLLRHGADVNAVSRNATGYTALTGAVAQGHTAIVALLLERGARASHSYAQGFTPLHEAAAGGKTEIARLLLDHGADPRARQQDGRTPLDLATEKGQEGVAALLRQRGAA